MHVATVARYVTNVQFDVDIAASYRDHRFGSVLELCGLAERRHFQTPAAERGDTSLPGEFSIGPVLKPRGLSFIRQNRGLGHLPGAFHCLDASRPWLVYWILHSMELLGQKPEETTRNAVRDFLKRCQNPGGGFGGGPGQVGLHMYI